MAEERLWKIDAHSRFMHGENIITINHIAFVQAEDAGAAWLSYQQDYDECWFAISVTEVKDDE